MLKWIRYKIQPDPDLPPVLEATRVKVLRRFKRLPLLALLLALPSLGWMCLKNYLLWGKPFPVVGFAEGGWAVALAQLMMTVLWVLVFLVIYLYVFILKPLGQFQTDFRKVYVAKQMNCLPGFEEVRYRQGSGFSWQEVHARGLLPAGTQGLFQSGDLLMGKCGGLEFTSVSVVTAVPNKGRSSAPVTQFEGQLITVSGFDEHKISHSVVQVLSREHQRDKDCVRVSQQVQTEDRAFNEQFSVWSQDPHNAFYVLTPQLLDRLKTLHGQLGRPVYLNFDGSVLYLALDLDRKPFDVVLDDPQEKRMERVRQDAEQVRLAAQLATGMLQAGSQSQT